MLETFSPLSSSYFLDVNISVPYNEEICCPIPRRAVSTTHVYVSWASSKKRRRSSSNSLSDNRKETADWEATQELQEILLSQIPLDASFDEEDSESESDADVTNDSSSHSSLFGIPQLTSFDPACSPVKTRKDFMCDAFIDAVCTGSLLSFSERDSFRNSSSEDFSSVFMRRGPKAQRPKLGNSISKRPELGNSTSNLSEASFNERSKPVITPPVRVHNPLPRNSSFTNRKAATQGPEFGLLSVSPPRADDEETLMRRARVKSKKKPDTFKNEPHSQPPKRENSCDPFPSAIVNSDVIGNLSETARSIDVDL